MAELGTKHECCSCQAKFYDFGKTPVICPKCETDQDQSAPEEKPPPEPEAPEVVETEAVAKNAKGAEDNLEDDDDD